MNRLVEQLIGLLLRVAGKEKSAAAKEWAQQSVMFVLVGISNTIVGYVLYALPLFVFQRAGIFQGWDYLLAQGISFVLSVYWAFYWNNKLVFTLAEGETRSYWGSLFKTYITYSFTGLFLSAALLVLWIEWLGVSEYFAPLLNLIVSVPINFLLNKLWAFKK